jgi:DNA polymerase-4
MRHSIVMSANGIARQLGIRAGLRFADALKLCPSLRYVTADMPKYLVETKAAREVYQKYSDEIIPYGLDESWVILDAGASWDDARQLAVLIKLEIKYSMGLSASVGVSDNLIFSKIGSDYNKPDGLTVITRDNYRDIVWPLDVRELLFVGDVRKKTLTYCGIRTIGDVARADPVFLAKVLKCKVGYDLWAFAHGDDRNFHPENDRIESIGNTITPPQDLRNDDEVKAVIYMLASAVCARLKRHGLKTRCVAINIRDNKFNKTTRQTTMASATDSIGCVFDRAVALFKGNFTWESPLRSIGVRATSLDKCLQLSLFDDEEHDSIGCDVSSHIKRLTARLGKLELEPVGALGGW